MGRREGWISVRTDRYLLTFMMSVSWEKKITFIILIKPFKTLHMSFKYLSYVKAFIPKTRLSISGTGHPSVTTVLWSEAGHTGHPLVLSPSSTWPWINTARLCLGEIGPNLLLSLLTAVIHLHWSTGDVILKETKIHQYNIHYVYILYYLLHVYIL